MNSYNTKTLLVTTALAVRMLSIAQGLSDTTVQNSETRAIDTDMEFDGYTIEHVHAEYGPQRLLVDQIHKDLYSVSFVGHEKYLQLIGTQGWESSADALVNYLCDMHPELELSLDEFRCTEIGELYVVYSLASEDELSIEEDEQLRQLFFGKLMQDAAREMDSIIGTVGADAFEEVVRPVEDALSTDTIRAEEVTVDQAVEHPEDTDTPRAAKFRDRALKFLGSPAGVATCTVVAAVVFFGARAIANSINLPDVPVEELVG